MKSGLREAFYAEKRGDRIRCTLCPKYCTLKPGQIGFCRVRKNEDGKLVVTNYAECSSVALDPIEKKPLYHFYPGSQILSLGTVGCNLACQFCQNWEISQTPAATRQLSPEEVVSLAQGLRDREGCCGVAYTYSEPVVWYEYVYDTSRLVAEAGLKNVLVTNGLINEEPLKNLLPYVDALNIDVKGFTDEFYAKYCLGRLDPVLKAARLAAEHCHVEITNLIIPGCNDDRESITRLVDWVAGTLGISTPLHFSRYHPDYKFDAPPTPLSTLAMAYEIASSKLQFVYIGNAIVPGIDGSNTYCYNCKQCVIVRKGFSAVETRLDGTNCGFCGAKLNLVV